MPSRSRKSLSLSTSFRLALGLGMGSALFFFVGSFVSLFSFLKILAQAPPQEIAREALREELRKESRPTPSASPPPLTEAMTRVVSMRRSDAPQDEGRMTETKANDGLPTPLPDPLQEARKILERGHAVFQTGGSIQDSRQTILDAVIELQKYSMERNQGTNQYIEETRALVSLVLESEDPSPEFQGEVVNAYQLFLTTVTDAKTAADRTAQFLEHQKDPALRKAILKHLYTTYPGLKVSR